MSEERLLDHAEWRIFRLFLVDLEDEELSRVSQQLQCEIKNRRDCETDFTQLFFTSLQAADLETARQTTFVPSAWRASSTGANSGPAGWLLHRNGEQV